MSNPAIRFGVIVGLIGLVINIFVAGLVGLCGPITSLVAGASAGSFAARAVQSATRNDGARVGATSGAIAGGFVLIGQIIGGVTALLIIRASGSSIFGELPTDSASQVGFWIGGLGFGTCLGLVGVGLAALTGAGAAYFATPEQPAASTYAPAGYAQPPASAPPPYGEHRPDERGTNDQ